MWGLLSLLQGLEVLAGELEEIVSGEGSPQMGSLKIWMHFQNVVTKDLSRKSS